MSDDSLKQKASINQVQKDSQNIPERPLDPTRNAEDFLGDMTGRTGVTTGDPRQVSAEPDEVAKDDSVVRGGDIDDAVSHTPAGFTKDQLSDKAYDEQVVAGMSAVEARANADLASENELDVSLEAILGAPGGGSDPDPMGTNSMTDPEDIPLAESGEESASGSAPGVDSTVDAGEMMKAYNGFDPDPDMDNPQELGVGEIVDQAEQDIETS